MSAPVEPLPALGPDISWWRIESLAEDFSDPIDLTPRATDQSFNDRANTNGGAALTLPTASPEAQQLLSERRVIRFGIIDLAASAESFDPVYKWVAAALADRPKATVISSKESSGETATTSCRGILAQWSYVDVDPPGGAGVEPDARQRVWNFSHSAVDPFSGDWVDADYRSVQGSLTADPLGRNATPYSFSNPLAFWLAPTPVPGTNDYNGVYLLAFDYELDADSQVIFDATAANAFMLWVNERLIGSVWDYPDGDAAKEAWRASAHFEAGPLRVRVAVGNFPNLNPGGTTTTNGGLFVMAASRPTTTDAETYDEEWLFTTADGWDLSGGTPGRWRALDYTIVNNEPPGPRVGQPLVDLLDEWQARGQLTAWSLGFTATHDSGGNLWPVINGLAGFQVDVGTSGLDVLDAMRDAGMIEYDVRLDVDGLPVLYAWSPGTAGVEVGDGLIVGTEGATGANVLSVEYDVDHSGARDQLLVSFLTGTVRVGEGPRSGFLETDAVTVEEAIAAGTAQLGRAETITSVTAEMTWTDQTAGPYWSWGKFDTIPAVASTGLPTASRVLGFNVKADSGTGRPIYTPVLEANPPRPEERIARNAMSIANGNLGGRALSAIPTSPRQRPMEKVDLETIEWSVPGPAALVQSGLAPPPKLMRLNRMLVTADSGSADTYLAVLADGSLAADATIGAGTDVEVWRSFLASVLRPSSRIRLAVGAGGDLSDHENLVIIGYGAALGAGASPAQVVR